MSQLNQDFKELLQLFAEHSIEYLIAGGYAVIHHTQPRYTKDLDLWIKPSPDNAKRLAVAFRKFGVPLVEVTLEDFEQAGLQFTIGIQPNAIDFLTCIPGLNFDEAWKNRAADDTLGFPTFYISLDDMITAKNTAGRLSDLADVEELERAKKIQSRE